MLSLSLFPTAATLSFAALSAAQSIVFDGRVLSNATGVDFDSASTSKFDAENVLGQNLTWSEVLQFPDVTQSRFDAPGDKAVEVTINDESIFAPSSTNVQVGFRRAELLPVLSDTNVSVSGVKTFHFSVQLDADRPLNFSHEYMLAFQEDTTFSKNQFTVETGTMFGTNVSEVEAKTIQVRGATNTASGEQAVLFQTPFLDGAWHNFGLLLDFDNNTLQVYFSTGQDALSAQGAAVANDLSGGGQFHFGVLKKPTGDGLTDITKQGFQESGINEGIIFGGIFEEDSSTGVVTL